MKRQYIFYIIFLLLVSFMRILPHPVGCSPLIAASLFICSTSNNKAWLLVLPAFFLLTAQLQTGFWQGWWIQPVSLFIVLLSTRGLRVKGLVSYMSMGLTASIIFFIVSNTGAWIAHALPYPMTFAGWLECMELGIPYFKPQLLWDVVFTTTIFGAYEVMMKLSRLPANYSYA